MDFTPNYDESLQEPSVLPSKIPNLLVNGSSGIAVGMASNICSFNLREICETTAALIRDPDHDIKSTLRLLILQAVVRLSMMKMS